MSWVRSTVNSMLNLWSPRVMPVRFRYHADKVARGPQPRRFGYVDPIDRTGLLPRESDKRIASLPIYRPVNRWSEKRALFGQNDYIDILGNENLHPTKILYDVPTWLRGVGGLEYHMLLRKKKILSKGCYPHERPSNWKNMNKRIKYLYTFLNQKTRTWKSNQW